MFDGIYVQCTVCVQWWVTDPTGFANIPNITYRHQDECHILTPFPLFMSVCMCKSEKEDRRKRMECECHFELSHCCTPPHNTHTHTHVLMRQRGASAVPTQGPRWERHFSPCTHCKYTNPHHHHHHSPLPPDFSVPPDIRT